MFYGAILSGALERLMGMFLVAMSVEMLLSGISRYFGTLAG